ncbi:hypothetical protein HI914_06606 [Erysiphe necator]|nr:hypothetical protein HI914_06606 [Erysiphe necator]
MPYFATSQEWLDQSALLIKARPTTTRITTKYKIPNLSSDSRSKRKRKDKVVVKDETKSLFDTTKTKKNETSATSVSPPATLTLKTYDPVSGVTLKYKTHKAAEVSRLVQIMGRLGNVMAGLDINEEVSVSTETTESKPLVVETPSGEKKSKGKKKNRK